MFALLDVVGGAVVFGPIIGQVRCAGAPEKPELVLRFAASEPVKTHVHCFRLSWLDVACDNAERRAVVGLHRCGRLWMAHFFEKLALGYRLAWIDVERAEFGFGCRRHYSFDELGNVEYSAIVCGVLCVG